MCGIFGISANNKNIDYNKARKALNTLYHRGPDSFGEYKDDKIYFGHRRLSIIDLSEKGNQPMISNCGNIILTANGEIYNYQELKRNLTKKYQFNSKSDSEVLIYGYLEWGIDKLLELIDGMYAFSLLDKRNNCIYLVRDRVGIKPLYYYHKDNETIWSSELKAINSYKRNLTVDLSSIYDYLTYKYIPSPKSLYINTFKLEPGHYIRIGLNDNSLKKIKFWEVKHKFENFKNINEVIEEVDYRLSESVRNQMTSDVEVGSFLSSGVDSSLISYYANSFKKKISTFTIGYNGFFDESSSALKFAKSIGSSHNEIILDEENILELIGNPKLFFDEPHGDISPQSYFLNFNASKKLKVILTGDGGDELFFGYNEYKRFLDLRKVKKMIPFKPFLKLFYQSKITEKLLYDDITLFLLQKGAIHKKEKNIFKKILSIDNDYDDNWFFELHYNKEINPINSLELLDFKTFLPEHALTRVDRNSMLFGLECRVPFLSNKMIDLAFSIRPHFKYHKHTLKYITREILKEYSDSEYAYSKKAGFSLNSSLRKKFYPKWEKNENISMIKNYLS